MVASAPAVTNAAMAEATMRVSRMMDPLSTVHMWMQD